MLVTNKINKLYINKPADLYLGLSKNIVIAKSDSGASANYWYDQEKYILQNILSNTSVNITLSNAESISSTLSGTIILSNKLSAKAK